MITIGFNLEVDEGASAPSPSEFADALAEALPKEWWADTRCSDWGVTGLFPMKGMSSSEALALGHSLAAKDKRIRKLEAVFSQERKMVAHLEEQVDKLSEKLLEKNDSIKVLTNTIRKGNDTQDDFAKRVRELIDERDDLKTRLDDSLVEWKYTREQLANLIDKNNGQYDIINEYQIKIKDYQAKRAAMLYTIGNLNREIDRVKDGWHKANEENSELRTIANSRKNTVGVMDRIIFEKEQKLTAAYAEIDELRDRGFTLSDDTLTRLETLSEQVKTYTDQASDSATTAAAYLVDLDALLDNIRTER